jgi:hypothetical protein
MGGRMLDKIKAWITGVINTIKAFLDKILGKI